MAQLIQEIFEVDPLAYPKCLGTMRSISFSEERPPNKSKILGVAKIPLTHHSLFLYIQSALKRVLIKANRRFPRSWKTPR